MSIYGGHVRFGWEHLKGEVLKKGGSTPMEGNLNLNGYRIRGLGLPWRSGDAVNKDYLDTQISQIPKPVITIMAEERGALVNGEFEWSFGSNSEGKPHMKVGYCMMTRGRLLAMSLAAADRNGQKRM